MTAAPPSPPLVPFISLSWVKAAARCGFNLEPILRELGIEADLLQVGQPTISLAQLDALMVACVARAQRHHFPLVLGDAFAFDYLPDLETFLTTSATLRESTRVFDWVRALVNPLIAVRVHETGEQAQLLLDLTGGDPSREHLPPLHYFTEATFATIVKFARMLLGEVPPDAFELQLRHPRPGYAAECERAFGGSVRFEQPRNALIFARALLDKPLEGAFPALHRQAEHLVERRLTRLPQKAGVSRAVEQMLAGHPELLGRGIERVAERLKMHPRTLQRRLREEGQSFAGLLARARFQEAIELLRHSHDDLESISDRLGFSDRRSFTRAFTRWAGRSPSSYRRKPAQE